MQTRQHIEELIRVSQMYYDEGITPEFLRTFGFRP